MCFARRAACHREILARQVHQPSVDSRASCHHAVGGQLLFRHAEVRGPVPRKQPDLLKAALVRKPVHALARRKLARFVLPVDALLPAAQLQLRAFRLQLRNLVVHAFLVRDFFLSQHFFTWGKLRKLPLSPPKAHSPFSYRCHFMLRDEGGDVIRFTLHKPKEAGVLRVNARPSCEPFSWSEKPGRPQRAHGCARPHLRPEPFRTVAFSVAYRKGATRLVKAGRAQHREILRSTRY